MRLRSHSLAAEQDTKAGRISAARVLHSRLMDASRRLTRALWVLLAIDLLLQVWGLQRGWNLNPNLQAPVGDASTYWSWSEEIADGQLVGETPFLSAPLYPYFLGLVRALGGGLLTVFALQLLLRSLTAYFLARIGGRLGGHLGYGLAAAAVFLCLSEPAFYATRVLNVSLQLFTVVVLLYLCMGLRHAEPKRQLVCGVVLALTILSNPSLLIVLPVFALWLGLRGSGMAQTALVVGTCVMCLLPATIHNYLATKDSPGGSEFIFLSAQAGVTFSHGNAPGANGTYQPLEGVSANRDRQNQDAYDHVFAATGEQGWSHTSSYFLSQGLDYLLGNPGEAIALEFQKLRWFFAGDRYGDLYNISLENADDSFPRPIPLPSGFLPLPWILPWAFLGLWILWRRQGRDFLPFAALLLAPLVVVLVFWFSPRYRLPIAPVAALLAPFGVAWMAQKLGQRFSFPTPKGTLTTGALLALVPGALITTWSRATDFDSVEGLAARYELHNGLNALELNQAEESLRRFRRALELGHEDAVLHESMAEALVRIGSQFDQAGQRQEADASYVEAIEEYRKALAINPRRLDAHYSLTSVLQYVGRIPEAKQALDVGIAEAQRQQNEQVLARFRQLEQKLR